MARAAADPNLLATDLADRLVLAGSSLSDRRTRLSANSCCWPRRENVSLAELDPDVFMDAAPVLTPQVVREVFRVDNALAARRAPGAPSSDNVAQRMAHWKSVLAMKLGSTVAHSSQ